MFQFYGKNGNINATGYKTTSNNTTALKQHENMPPVNNGLVSL